MLPILIDTKALMRRNSNPVATKSGTDYMIHVEPVLRDSIVDVLRLAQEVIGSVATCGNGTEKNPVTEVVTNLEALDRWRREVSIR